MAEAPILSWEGLGLQQGGRWLFRELDLHIGPRDRLARLGRNGAGKTTLFRLIADLIEADKGKRSVQPGTRIVLLEQEPDFARLRPISASRSRGPMCRSSSRNSQRPPCCRPRPSQERIGASAMRRAA